MTAAPRGTPDQRRAIEATGADLCVVAGAGTGKTFVLTERLVKRVLGDGVPLSNVLAITFTEKAAAEMKQRLTAALERAGRATAREDVEAAAISTVHAFCARLLRENSVAAGVDPAFTVLDEVQSSRLLREAVEAFEDDWRDNDPAGFRALAALGGDDPAGTLVAIYQEAQASGRPLGEFVRDVPDLPPIADALAPLRTALAGLAPVAGRGTEAAKRNVAAAIEAASGLGADDASAEALESAVAAIGDAVKLTCGEPAKSALAAVRAAVETALPVVAEHAMTPLREVVARAVERLDAHYTGAKGRDERLDFADLERAAVALLAARADVRDEVRRRRPEVLVDEFQDTSPVQARLVDLLRTDGRLFVVGDPKQSIYGFRGADVGVFEERLRTVAAQGNGGVVSLRHSFRARPEVLGFVSRLFTGGVAGATGEGATVDLVAGRSFAAPAAPAVEVRVAPAEDLQRGREDEAAWIAARIAELVESQHPIADPSDADPLRTRACQFEDIAVLLRATTHVKLVENALVAAGVPYVVVKGRGFFRAREVIDAANLLACIENPRDDLTFAAVLRSPCCGASDDALFVLARARADDGTALIDVLDAWSSGALPLEALPDADAAALSRFVTVFRELRARRATDGVAALVERALAATRLEVLALARPNGRQRAANLRKVLTLAREAGADGISLREFIDDVRTLREREVREAEASVAGGTIGAVSLMTVHAAKGLEFPVVFVPDVTRAELTRTGRVLSDVRLGVGLRGRAGVDHETAPWAFARLAEAKRAADQAESERLLYVAVTRAADHLVLTGTLNDAGDGPARRRVWWDRLAPVAGAASADVSDQDLGPGADEAGATRIVVRRHPGAPCPAAGVRARNYLGAVAASLAAGVVPPRPLSDAARSDAATLLDEAARRAPPQDHRPFATNVTALTTFARCPQEYRLRHVLGVPEDGDTRLFGARTAFDTDEPEPAGDERPGDTDEPDSAPSSRALGRAAHAALERLVPQFDGDVAGEVVAALRAETGGGEPDPADVAKLCAWIERFRRSDLGAAVFEVPRSDVRREQAFLLRAGATAIRGQIDLLWREPHGWSVVDYKTGSLEQAGAEHELQMRLYAMGVRAVTGELPARLVLWSLPRGRAVPVSCGAEDVAAVERLLAEFGRRAAAADLAPRESPPCETCRVRAACAFAPPREDSQTSR